MPAIAQERVRWLLVATFFVSATLAVLAAAGIDPRIERLVLSLALAVVVARARRQIDHRRRRAVLTLDTKA